MLESDEGATKLRAMGQYNHIAGYRVTCVQGCFEPVWIPAGPGADTPSLHKRLNRPCKKCGIGVGVEGIWADDQGRVPAGAPEDVPGERQPVPTRSSGWS